MAYVSKEQKKEIAALLKKAFPGSAKQRGFKYSLAIRNYSSIEMNISAGSIDFMKEYEGRDSHSISFEHNFKGSDECKEIIRKALKCLNLDNYDNSDIMTDYFDVGHYVHINIGRWDKPYKLEA